MGIETRMVNTDRIAESLAGIRIFESTHPKLAEEQNEALDKAIVAICDSIGLNGLISDLFCARAHFGRVCEKLED